MLTIILSTCTVYMPNFYRFLQKFSAASQGVMVSVLASSAVDRGIETWSGQTKDYNIGICCFSTKHTALRRKRKNCFTQNQDNLSQLGDMSIRRLLFQWTSTIKIQNYQNVSFFSSSMILMGFLRSVCIFYLHYSNKYTLPNIKELCWTIIIYSREGSPWWHSAGALCCNQCTGSS